MDTKIYSLRLLALGAISLTFGLSLLACGDSSSSDNEQTVGGFPSVETFEDLVHCTKSHYGEISHVKETDSLYECTGEGWVVIDSSDVEDLLSSSSGVEGGKSSAADDVSSSSVLVSAEDTSKVDVVKVDSTTLTGLAQKGPFLSGTAVTVYGLDSAFARTKTKFSGKVAGDSGAYSVAGIVHSSQYAEVEVLGFYKNEFTGKNTSGTKTKLSALVDMSAVEKGENKSLVKANVNLFTEFERARSLKLIKNEKYNVPAAKIRASREIVNIFGKNFDIVAIDTAKVGSATGMSLADTGVVGRALYAAGVMMTTGLSVSKSANLIANVSDDIAENGAWNSDTTRALVADNLCYQDSVDGFAAVRKNIKEMKIAAAAPNFEANLQYFWYNELGLGECTDSLETAETVRKVSNKLSDNYRSGFACTSKRWHKVTALDTELGMCTSKMEGVYKESLQKTGKKYYTCEKGTWKEISKTVYELKSCTENIAKTDSAFRKVGEEYFLCANNQWNDIDSAHYVLKFCTDAIATSKDAYRKVGDAYYLCAGGEWEKIDEVAFELKVCSDTTSKVYRNIGKEYFYCDGSKWNTIDEITYNLKVCDETVANGKSAYQELNDKFYLCKDSKWNEIEKWQYELKTCSKQDSVAKTSGGVKYICDEAGEGRFAWRKASDVEYDYGVSCTENEIQKLKDGGTYYLCENSQWRVATAGEVKVGLPCNESRRDSVKWTGDFNETYPRIPDETKPGEYYVCKNGDWKPSDRIEFMFGASCTENQKIYALDEKYREAMGIPKTEDSSEEMVRTLVMLGLTSYNDTYYLYNICQNGIWTPMTEADYTLGFCTESMKGQIDSFDDRNFLCGDEGWNECSVGSLYTLQGELACDYAFNEKGEKITKWRDATEYELKANAVCNAKLKSYDSKGWIYDDNGSAIYCRNECDFGMCIGMANSYSWQKAGSIDLKAKAICYEKNNGKVFGDYACVYKAEDLEYGWRSALIEEKETKLVCNSSVNQDTLYSSNYCGVLHVYCDHETNKWKCAGEDDVTTGYPCSQKHLLEYKNGMVCDSFSVYYKWREASAVEKKSTEVCKSQNVGNKVVLDGMNFTCEKNASTGDYVYKATYVDSRDDNSYLVQSVGKFIWMDALRYNHSSVKSVCQEGDEEPCKKGRLYYGNNFYGSSSLCPNGWKVPSGIPSFTTHILNVIPEGTKNFKYYYYGYQELNEKYQFWLSSPGGATPTLTYYIDNDNYEHESSPDGKYYFPVHCAYGI